MKNENKLNQMLPGNRIKRSPELLAKIKLVGGIPQADPNVKGRFSLNDKVTPDMAEAIYNDYALSPVAAECKWKNFAAIHKSLSLTINLVLFMQQKSTCLCPLFHK